MPPGFGRAGMVPPVNRPAAGGVAERCVMWDFAEFQGVGLYADVTALGGNDLSTGASQ